MNYAKYLIETALRNERTYRASAMIALRNGITNIDDKAACTESLRLSNERIPQLEEMLYMENSVNKKVDAAYQNFLMLAVNTKGPMLHSSGKMYKMMEIDQKGNIV